LLILRRFSGGDNTRALASLGINYGQDNVIDHSLDRVSNLARLTIEIALLKGERIVEHTASRFEADTVLLEVAPGFGGIPLEFASIMYGLPVVMSSQGR
jgi:hypothetical protein